MDCNNLVSYPMPKGRGFLSELSLTIYLNSDLLRGKPRSFLSSLLCPNGQPLWKALFFFDSRSLKPNISKLLNVYRNVYILSYKGSLVFTYQFMRQLMQKIISLITCFYNYITHLFKNQTLIQKYLTYTQKIHKNIKNYSNPLFKATGFF